MSTATPHQHPTAFPILPCLQLPINTSPIPTRPPHIPPSLWQETVRKIEAAQTLLLFSTGGDLSRLCPVDREFATRMVAEEVAAEVLGRERLRMEHEERGREREMERRGGMEGEERMRREDSQETILADEMEEERVKGYYREEETKREEQCEEGREEVERAEVRPVVPDVRRSGRARRATKKRAASEGDEGEHETGGGHCVSKRQRS